MRLRIFKDLNYNLNLLQKENQNIAVRKVIVVIFVIIFFHLVDLIYL